MELQNEISDYDIVHSDDIHDDSNSSDISLVDVRFEWSSKTRRLK